MSDDRGQTTLQDAMSCRELVEVVTDYLEGTMPEADRRRFDEHIAGCPYCRRYVEQMREVIRTLGRLDEESLPRQAMDELLEAFRDWKRP